MEKVEPKATTSPGRASRYEARVLWATWLPLFAAFAWALHLRSESARLPLSLDLSRPQLRVQFKGLSGLEAWGRWSEGDEVQIVLPGPLPRRFDLVLEARAFGPNVGQPVEVRVGDEVATVVLSADMGTVRAGFRAGSGRSVTLRVPRPTSPSELHLGDDARKLGLGLARVALLPGGTP